MGTEEPWVDVDEVAAHLGVTRDSVYRWVESKNLPARRVGRLLRFRLSEIDAWVEAGAGAGDARSGGTAARGRRGGGRPYD